MFNQLAPWIAVAGMVVIIGLACWLEWSKHQIFIGVNLGDVTADDDTYSVTDVRIQAQNWCGAMLSAEIAKLSGKIDSQTGVFRLDRASRGHVYNAAYALLKDLDFADSVWSPVRFEDEVIRVVETRIDDFIITPQRVLMAMEMSRFFGQTHGIIP